MKLGFHINYAGSIHDAVGRAVALERAGIDIVWVPELYGFDAVSIMGFLAAKTERVQIGSSILPIYSRTPALTAQTAAGLDYVSGGRTILGLGVSGPQVIEGWHGVPYDHPIGRTREVVDICRKLWKREVVEYHGSHYELPLPAEKGTGLGKPLKMIMHPVRDRIPVYIASLGDKNVELTAEIAEGWLSIFFIPERADQVWGTALAKGKAKRAAELGPLEVVAGAPVAIGDNLEHLRELDRPHLALYVGGMGARNANFYNDLACRYGFQAEAKVVQDLYLSGRKDEAAAAIPAALLEGVSLIGSKEYVRDRLAAYKQAGVTVFNAAPVGVDAVQTVTTLKEIIATL